MYLSEFAGLGGITPQQYQQLQQQLYSLQSQLNAENQQWNFLVANSVNPPASDQHNATVASLNAQIASVMQQLQQPVDYGTPAPAPAPMSAPAPAPAPVSSPSQAVSTTYAAPLTPQAGASQTATLLPTEVDVASAGPAPLQLTDVTTTAAPAASSGGNGGLLLLLLGGAAALMGGS